MNHPRRVTLASVVGCTGIVYGDIGTSPLYAFEAALGAAGPIRRRGGARRAVADLLGLPISVTLKYIVAHHARRQRR